LKKDDVERRYSSCSDAMQNRPDAIIRSRRAGFISEATYRREIALRSEHEIRFSRRVAEGVGDLELCKHAFAGLDESLDILDRGELVSDA
jgi:hypothetical protein